METTKAIAHLSSVDSYDVERYLCYFNHITPKNTVEVFKRWLFSYASVHTTWKLNCKLYYALADLQWMGDPPELARRIKDSGAGMHNKRFAYISAFTDFFWKHPLWFNHSAHESWEAYRQRLEHITPGIGFAKSAFGIEMMYPESARVVCTDTHILQLYGYSTGDIKDGKIPRKIMTKIQAHWVDTCVSREIPPVAARWIYWDRKQKQSGCRYWTCVFEKENYNERLGQLARHPQRPAAVARHIDSAPARKDSSVPTVHEAIPHAALLGRT